MGEYTANDSKWKARAGVIYCEKTEYSTYQGRVILPGSKNKQTVFRILDVGPGVEGYEKGDLVIAEKVFETAMGYFIREPYVYGKLLAKDVAPSDTAKFEGERPMNASPAELKDLVENGTKFDDQASAKATYGAGTF
jgi:hypothetical protein